MVTNAIALPSGLAPVPNPNREASHEIRANIGHVWVFDVLASVSDGCGGRWTTHGSEMRFPEGDL